MKKLMTVSFVAFASIAQALPEISSVTISQNHFTRKVTIEYLLRGEDAVVTVDIQTNALAGADSGWVSIGAENLIGFVGDVNRKVSHGENVRTIKWNPDTYWPGHTLPARTTRAIVTAWATNAPPDWLVCELTAPYDVTYYQHVCQVPDGVTSKKYKRTHMLFRKIPAKGVVWTMGAGGTTSADAPHKVALTEDYYIGVYQLTKAQTGATSIDDVQGSTPYNDRTYHKLRGNVKGAQWPMFKADGSMDYVKSHEVDEGSIIYGLRNKCRLLFDLPTEAQWEYAARAGETRAVFGDGTITVGNLALFGRFRGDLNKTDCEGFSGALASVGSYRPNAFGLYDVLGNVYEGCLDWYESFENVDVDKVHCDPIGALTGTARVYRGGTYYYDGGNLASRSWESPDGAWAAHGYRLAIPLY